jgi:hypothetical protein
MMNGTPAYALICGLLDGANGSLSCVGKKTRTVFSPPLPAGIDLQPARNDRHPPVQDRHLLALLEDARGDFVYAL